MTGPFDERMQDLEEYRPTHGQVDVKTHEDNSLGHFCADVRHVRKSIDTDRKWKLTEERIARLNALGVKW